jgi:hypothetical protein
VLNIGHRGGYLFLYLKPMSKRRKRPDEFRLKMRSESYPGTHHIVFQLNLRSHSCGPKFLLAGCPNHSLLRLLTGFASAAFIAWKLMVTRVMTIAAIAEAMNTPTPMLTR